MDTDVIDLWDRYVLLEAERCVVVGGLLGAPDPAARQRDIQREQAQLKARIGEPLFGELVEAEL